jgi:predicted nucleic acid-binding protein
MKKKKIYLDTSVISYLDQQDVPVEMQQTRELWEVFKSGKYDIVISEIALSEIGKCDSIKRGVLDRFIEQISYEKYSLKAETRALAELIVQEEILSTSHFTDCIHLASAILTCSNIVLSWNFKHLVRTKTIKGIRSLLFKNFPGKTIDIYAPYVLLEQEDQP